MDDYLVDLKNTDLRPPKVQITEHMLLDQEERGVADIHEEIIKWFIIIFLTEHESYYCEEADLKTLN